MSALCRFVPCNCFTKAGQSDALLLDWVHCMSWLCDYLEAFLLIWFRR
jgi:hypothetical protein